MQNKNFVVAHFRDGRLLRGSTADFALTKPVFHIAEPGASKGTQVRCDTLKALYFVKQLPGNGERQDLRGFVEAPNQTKQGHKVAVQYPDGELLCGWSQTWAKDRDSFFLFPADTGSNNQRVLVLVGSATQIASGPEADKLALSVLGARK